MSGAPMKNLGPVPVDAIRALSALEVGERLGILTQDVENPQSGRYAFKGCHFPWLKTLKLPSASLTIISSEKELLFLLFVSIILS